MRILAIFCLAVSVAAHLLLMGVLELRVPGPKPPGEVGDDTPVTVQTAPPPGEEEPAEEEPAEAEELPAVPVASQTQNEEDTTGLATSFRDAGTTGAPVAADDDTASTVAEAAEPTPETVAKPTPPQPEPKPIAKPSLSDMIADAIHEPPEPAPEPARATSQPTPKATPQATPKAVRTGPQGLRVPSSVLKGTPSADLVIDPRPADFVSRARALGCKFILFEQRRAPSFFYEILGNDLDTAERRTKLDTERFAQRARDLNGIPRFDRARARLAVRLGLPADRTRLVAVVPHGLERAFRSEERRALRALELQPRDVRALFGALTDDPRTPLRVTHALRDSIGLIEVPTVEGSDD